MSRTLLVLMIPALVACATDGMEGPRDGDLEPTPLETCSLVVDEGASSELSAIAWMNGTANLKIECLHDSGEAMELSIGNGAYGRYVGPGTYTIDRTTTFGSVLYRDAAGTSFSNSNAAGPSSGCSITIERAPVGVPPAGSQISGRFTCTSLTDLGTPARLVDVRGSFDVSVR